MHQQIPHRKEGMFIYIPGATSDIKRLTRPYGWEHIMHKPYAADWDGARAKAKIKMEKLKERANG